MKRYQCRDCKFIDERGDLDKCPYCRNDDWVKLGKPKPSTEHALMEACIEAARTWGSNTAEGVETPNDRYALMAFLDKLDAHRAAGKKGSDGG